MAELLSVDQVQDFLGNKDPADVALLELLIDQVIAAFQAAIGRSERPYTADPQTVRVELRDGTGNRDLWLDYPIQTLTDPVLIGRDPSSQVSLAPADPLVLSWKVGGRRLSRVDGCRFGCLGDPNLITVTYGADADPLPADVQLVILRVIAANYRETGRPEALHDREQDETQPLPFVADRDPLWLAAIEQYREIKV